jgi:hypothetical protein
MTTTTPGTGPTGTPTTGDSYVGLRIHLFPYGAAVTKITDASLKAKVASVAKVLIFIRSDVVAKVPALETYLTAPNRGLRLARPWLSRFGL